MLAVRFLFCVYGPVVQSIVNKVAETSAFAFNF